MEKRHLLNLIFFIMVLISFSFISCGKNDDHEDIPIEEPSVKKENSSFMGYWKDEIGHWNLLLFDDGTCVANDAYDGNSKVDGKWTFDTETKYLVNSATKSTFLLTLYDEEDLMGVNIKNNSTVSYKK